MTLDTLFRIGFPAMALILGGVLLEMASTRLTRAYDLERKCKQAMVAAGLKFDDGD